MGILKNKFMIAMFVLTLAGLGVGAVLGTQWWVPQLNKLVDRVILSEDQTSSANLAKTGAQETTQQVEAFHGKQTDIETRTSRATKAIRAAPTYSTPLPAADLSRLRAADVELCKLGVRCVEQEPSAASRPAAAPAAPSSKGPVPGKHVTDAGDTDLR